MITQLETTTNNKYTFLKNKIDLLQENKQESYFTAKYEIEGQVEKSVKATARYLSGSLAFSEMIPAQFGNNGIVEFSMFPPPGNDRNEGLFLAGDILFENSAIQYAQISLADVPANRKMNWDVLNVNLINIHSPYEFGRDAIFNVPILATIYSPNGRTTTTGILRFLYSHRAKEFFLVACIPFPNPQTSESANEIYIYLSSFDSGQTRGEM